MHFASVRSHHEPEALLAGDPLDDLLQEGPYQDAGALGPRLILKMIVSLVTIVQLTVPSPDASRMLTFLAGWRNHHKWTPMMGR